MNLANKLTLFRIFLVIIMVIVAYVPINGTILNIGIDMWILNIIFIIASITDKLDGNIARKRNQITEFGKFLDPIADKMLVLSAMLILVERRLLPAWIPIIILIREFAVSGYRLIAVQKENNVIAASIWGKTKTVTQIIAIIFAFININNTNIFMNFVNGEIIGIALVINCITSIMFILATIATVISGIDYLKNGKELLLKDC
mgnify:CR=1 FL=1